MIRWMRTVRMFWWRFDRWLEERERRAIANDRLSIWWDEPRMPGVEDTGTVVATPEDLAEISIADPVTRRVPGQRRGRHAKSGG